MSVPRWFSHSVLILFAIGSIMISGCSSSKPALTATSRVAEGYGRAVNSYEKKDYDAAVLLLESLLFTSRATALEDDVLFLLGKSYYYSGQYMLASDMFTRLLRQMPSTPFARTAQFMIAKSCEQLSAHFELDQQYTSKAIEQFALYLDIYPVTDSAKVSSDLETYRSLLKLNPENQSYKQNYATALAQFSRIDSVRYAAKAIPVLREKLAKNLFFIARQYVQLKKYKAAGIFYDELIKRYSDTVYVRQAWSGKIDVLVKRQKWFDAGQALDQYLQLYPDQKQQMHSVREQIAKNFSKK
ncbi:MAG: outer membrane protein assembly factor BamD [Chlorobium sp.]|nr:MAG: outer membrane protein assembly factor BamD [Chlorobium sp.]